MENFSENKTENKQFSVSMCVYGKDNPKWFARAVESVLEQTVKPSEVVLVVDGPVPNELDEYIQALEQKEELKIVRLAENQGHGNARRVGLENCSHNLVALMDADDVSLPTRFEKQLALFEADEDLAVVGGNISEFIDEEENVVSFREVFQSDEEIKKDLKVRCPFNQVSVMFKRDAVEAVGGYIDWFWEEDYYLWLRLHLAGAKFANVSETLVNVRVGKDMYARRGGWKYFKSERKLQKFMRKNKIIGYGRYVKNVAKRLIVQVLLPNRLRGWVFKKFARKRIGENGKV